MEANLASSIKIIDGKKKMIYLINSVVINHPCKRNKFKIPTSNYIQKQNVDGLMW